MSEILVVSNDRVGLACMLGAMETAGYRATGVSTFEEANQLLSDHRPDLVMADERLGAFNGLHVLMRARSRHPGLRTIVMTPTRNRALNADARSLHIECLVRSENPSDWLASICGAGQQDDVCTTR